MEAGCAERNTYGKRGSQGWDPDTRRVDPASCQQTRNLGALKARCDASLDLKPQITAQLGSVVSRSTTSTSVR
jgi:hypothetical protein